MKNKTLLGLVIAFAALFSMAGCADKDAKVKNGVMYASRLLQEVNANPLSRGTYQNLMARDGATVMDYVKYVTPKNEPMLELFEYDKPTHPYTVVIRPGTDPGEYFVTGFGADMKKPIAVETVTIKETQ
jgi:hypothetical protein